MRLKDIIRFLGEPVPRGEVGFLEKVRAFLIRDFKTWWTYKLWVMLDIIGSLTFVATYYFVAQIVTPDALISAGYTPDFLTFTVIGISFQQYVYSSVSSLSEAIRDEQWDGTIEMILSSRTGFKVFLLGESVFRFLVGSYFLLASLAMGVVIGAKLTLTAGSVLSSAVMALLLIASHMVVGALGAAAILKLKEGNPIVWAFTWLTQLLSGILYPLGLLPNYLQWLGALFPLTYSLDGLRRCLMSGDDLTSALIMQDVSKLLIFIAVMLPISLWAFKKAYDSTRREGSLGQY